MTTEKPLPCPFCGKAPDVRTFAMLGEAPEKHIVECDHGRCWAAPSVTANTKRTAIRRWNTRAGSTR